MSRTLGPVLDNHVEEMFARADIIWSDLDRFLAQQETSWEDKEAATALRHFMGQLYESLLQNMHAVSDALPWEPER